MSDKYYADTSQQQANQPYVFLKQPLTMPEEAIGQATCHCGYLLKGHRGRFAQCSIAALFHLNELRSLLLHSSLKHALLLLQLLCLLCMLCCRRFVPLLQLLHLPSMLPFHLLCMLLQVLELLSMRCYCIAQLLLQALCLFFMGCSCSVQLLL